MQDKLTIRYYISRDSLAGVLSDECDVWDRKPVRVRKGSRVTWVAGSKNDPGHLGEYLLEYIKLWHSTYPETDRELVCVDRWWP